MLSLNKDVISNITVANFCNEKVIPFYQISYNGKIIKFIAFSENIGRDVGTFGIYFNNNDIKMYFFGAACYAVTVDFYGEDGEECWSFDLICSLSGLNSMYSIEYLYNVIFKCIDIISVDTESGNGGSWFDIKAFKKILADTPFMKEWEDVKKWETVVDSFIQNESNFTETDGEYFGESEGYEFFPNTSLSFNVELTIYYHNTDDYSDSYERFEGNDYAVMQEIFPLYYHVMHDEIRNILFTVTKPKME